MSNECKSLHISAEHTLMENVPTVHACMPEEIVANFVALLHDVDFSKELRNLKIGRINIMLRRTMLLEMQATYIGLWALALYRSFPDTAETIFRHFAELHCAPMPSRIKKQAYNKIYDYKEMLLKHGDKDFSHVSKHLLSFSKVSGEDLKTEILRLSLLLRRHYTFLFERLV